MATASGQLAPGVLTYQEILELCGLKGNGLEQSESGPIKPCRRDNIRSASYDLRLGAEYHYTDDPPRHWGRKRSMRVLRLKPRTDEHILIRPNQVVVISCMEKICMPPNMVGHLTLKQDILLQGLIMGSQSQIDAGYRGWIYPLLYNLTDCEVALQLNKSVIRLELVRLPQVTDKPYDGDYQEKTLSESLKRPVGSSLTELRERVDRNAGQIKRSLFWTVGIGIAAIAVAIVLAVATGFVAEVHDSRDAVSHLEGEIQEPLKLDGDVARLESRVAALQRELRQEK